MRTLAEAADLPTDQITAEPRTRGRNNMLQKAKVEKELEL